MPLLAESHLKVRPRTEFSTDARIHKNSPKSNWNQLPCGACMSSCPRYHSSASPFIHSPLQLSQNGQLMPQRQPFDCLLSLPLQQPRRRYTSPYPCRPPVKLTRFTQQPICNFRITSKAAARSSFQTSSHPKIWPSQIAKLSQISMR